jgi:cyanophycinase-like exopeptidase
MLKKKGFIALMGSGELTSTMVTVHKELLVRVPAPPRPVFLDTPAGFQLNADHLGQKAVEYFRDHVQQPMSVASFKNKDEIAAYDAELAFHALREAHFILIGPGSPTYAVRQWKGTPIPEILAARVRAGGCLVAASAAALTVGRCTLPVYEIYKVGESVHWIDGVDVLSHFGLKLVVIPHWNNAEGGAHDTRFCYMGEPRFLKLESMLPRETTLLGLDEHTACLMDFEKDQASVRGIGQVTVRRAGAELKFGKGDVLPLDLLRESATTAHWNLGGDSLSQEPESSPVEERESGFWQEIHRIESHFRDGIESGQAKDVTRSLLELDRLIWQAASDRESDELIAQAREILRDMVVFMGVQMENCPKDSREWLAPVIEQMLSLRERFRAAKKWAEADEVRDSLLRANIVVEDTPDGARWHVR